MEVRPQAPCADNDEEQSHMENLLKRSPDRDRSKSSLTRLAEEEQLVAAERLQKIKKKKEENALRQAQIQEQE